MNEENFCETYLFGVNDGYCFRLGGLEQVI